MNIFTKLILVLATLAASLQAQTALVSTTLSAAITSTQSVFAVASATGISAGVQLYVIDKGENIGEMMTVRSISSTTVTVNRFGVAGNKVAHVSGSYVLVGQPNQFYTYNPYGACTTASTLFTPWVNVRTGEQWLCSTLSLNWVAGFNNAATKNVTANVASAAGAILPSGPLFHVTGTSAVTGFTLPVGFTGGEFSIIPDGAFTWTTAGNIALAGTAVVSRVITFRWDSNAGKFYPTYV